MFFSLQSSKVFHRRSWPGWHQLDTGRRSWARPLGRRPLAISDVWDHWSSGTVVSAYHQSGISTSVFVGREKTLYPVMFSSLERRIVW